MCLFQFIVKEPGPIREGPMSVLRKFKSFLSKIKSLFIRPKAKAKVEQPKPAAKADAKKVSETPEKKEGR
jgi:hypothetical protein